jgi:hypothetical protein
MKRHGDSHNATCREEISSTAVLEIAVEGSMEVMIFLRAAG